VSLALSARLATRELRGGFKGFRILIACLALGVAAIAVVGSIKQAIEAGLSAEGATLLGGDAEAEFTYRFASDEERAWLSDISERMSEVVDFRSMILVERDGEKERALTQVKAIDDAYPLSGHVHMADGSDFRSALLPKDGLASLVMERLLVDRLGIVAGDEVKIGTKTFRLGGILKSLPDGAGEGFGLGPRTLVYKTDLDDAGLLVAGTFFSSKYRLDLPEGTDFEVIADLAEPRFASSGLRWRDARNGAPGVAIFVERLAAFLVFVGLSGLAVGGVGVSAAVSSYLSIKKSVIATLRSLGATNDIVFQVYFLQIACLSALGVFIGIILGVGLPILFAPMIDGALPFPIRIGVYGTAILQAGIYGVLMAVIFTLWPLAKIENIRATQLFRDMGETGAKVPASRYILAMFVLLGVLLACAAFFTGSLVLTLWSAFGIAVALVALLISALLMKRIAKWALVFAGGRPTLRWALASVSGPGEATASVILALGLGLSVLSSVGQIDGNLRDAIRQDLPKVAPSYFFVDIQKSQMPTFLSLMDQEDAVSKVETAPMLRGVVSQINGRPAQEVAGDHWVVRGDRGLTYAETLPENSKLVAGEWWPENYSGENQISFAAEEAEEMGLALGDELVLNILGRDIPARITSFREVNFSTAGIGFVMTINPSAIKDAPHSYIATVYAEEEAEARVLRVLADAFPNITAIRIKDAIERVSALLSAIAAATSYGAAVTLLTGVLVLIGAAAAGEHARRFEASVLKTLGAGRGRILVSFALRAGLMGAASAIIALLCGFAAGWAICRFVLDTDFHVMWPNAVATISGGILANIGAGLVFALRALNARPARVLRNYE